MVFMSFVANGYSTCVWGAVISYIEEKKCYLLCKSTKDVVRMLNAAMFKLLKKYRCFVFKKN